MAVDCWRADLAAASHKTGCSPLRAGWLVLTHPGVLAVGLFRLQQALSRHGHVPLAQLMRAVTHVLTGADFVPGCVVGPGLRIEHPSGIVIGRDVVVGRDAFICQHVTLGERLGDGRRPAYPTVGDGVFFGAGAIVLGGVNVGSGATIGAGAVVLADVPAGAVAVGNPARVQPASKHAL